MTGFAQVKAVETLHIGQISFIDAQRVSLNVVLVKCRKEYLVDLRRDTRSRGYVLKMIELFERNYNASFSCTFNKGSW